MGSVKKDNIFLELRPKHFSNNRYERDEIDFKVKMFFEAQNDEIVPRSYKTEGKD